MKDKDILLIEQMEDAVQPYRSLLDRRPPRGGWVRAIREALGMTSPQLAKRLGRKASQTIEDIQRSETTGTIKLNTLRELAEAMGCRLVYAIVPTKPIDELRRDQACVAAKKLLDNVSHSMRLEEQGLTQKQEQRELERLIQKILASNPKNLWK